MDARDGLDLSSQGLKSREAADLDRADDIREMQHIADSQGCLLALGCVAVGEVLDVVTGDGELARHGCRHRNCTHVCRCAGRGFRQYLVIAKREVEWASDVRQR